MRFAVKRLALTGWSNVGPSGVGKDFPISDDSNANFIGTALKSNDHRHGDFVKSVNETIKTTTINLIASNYLRIVISFQMIATI